MSKNWADVEDNGETDDFSNIFGLEPVPDPDASRDKQPAKMEQRNHEEIEPVSSPKIFDFMKHRKIEHVVLVDLDSIKKGIGKIGYRLLTAGTLSSIMVLMFRRQVSKGQRYFFKQTCLSCSSHIKIPITSKVLNGRVLIEGTSSTLSTKYLMGLYGGYFVHLLCEKKAEDTNPQFTIVSADDGCQELCSILSSKARVHSVRTEKSDSFDHLKSLLPPLDPTRHVVPPRSWEALDDDPSPAGNIETVLKRVCEKLSGLASHSRPRTRALLDQLLTPLCELRGEVDARAVLNALREKHKLFSVCSAQCETLCYHQSIDPGNDQQERSQAKKKTEKGNVVAVTVSEVVIEGDDPVSVGCQRVRAELISRASANKRLPSSQAELLEMIRVVVNPPRSIAIDVADVMEVMIAKGVVRFDKDMLLTEKGYPAVYHLENLPRLREVRAHDLRATITRGGEDESMTNDDVSNNNSAPISAASSFQSFKLHDSLVEGLRAMDITQPTDVQTQFFAAMSSRKSVMLNGRSGSGKTLSAVLYLLNSLIGVGSSQSGPLAVLISPFEPHAQFVLKKMIQPLAPKWLRVVLLMGTTAIADDIELLKQTQTSSGGVLVLAELSRLDALLARRALSLANVQVLVADEIDRLLPQSSDRIKSIREAAAVRAQLIGLCTTRMRPQALGDDLALFKRASKADDCLSVLRSDASSVVPPRAKHYSLTNADESRKLESLAAILRATDREPVLVFVHPNRKVTELISALRSERKVSRKLRALPNTAAELQNLYRDLSGGCTDALIASGATLAYGIFFQEIKLVVSLDLISPDVQLHISGRVANDWKEGTHLVMVSSKEQKSFELLRDTYRLGFGENWKQILKDH